MAVPSTWSVSDGDYVEVIPVSGGFTAQLYADDGAPEGQLFSAIQPHLGLYTFESVTPLAAGGYVLDYTYGGALLPGVYIETATFNAQGQLLGQAQASAPSLENGAFPSTTGQVYALPDGGFVDTWLDGAELVTREFNAVGQPVGAPQTLGVVTAGQPSVQVEANGQYVVSWSSPSGPQHETFTDGPGLPPFIAQSPATLSSAAGWTSAAVLSNGQLAVVSAQPDGYGSQAAVEHAYDGVGMGINSTALLGYAPAGEPLTPEIASLGVGGFYEVSYADSTNDEIYNGSDQLVFAHNAYTNPNGQFTALQTGGYVVTDFPDQVMGLYDIYGINIGWFGLQGPAPNSIVAGTDGGFDFVFSGHVQGYDAVGQQIYDDALGARASAFATATAALAGPALAEVWLSPDGGQDGLATSIRFETFGPLGESGALQVAQDLDPWGTTFQLQAHADGSAAILWSQGGGVFGAEYANGAIGPAYAAFAGDLSTTKAIEATGDKVGLAWVQNGDVWAEIFDPSTGAVQRADLGVSDGDLANVHMLATTTGDIAVSWREASGAVVGSLLGATGQVTGPTPLAGDFLGVNGAGEAVTLHDVGGTPVLQTYALNDGLFWAG